ncbi:hypothetical protein [Azospirillum sp.]|uniref:hypothetical protein n=1 Tax=Azospirillum sp. TaxID=34012 RepID=UPI003D754DB4
MTRSPVAAFLGASLLGLSTAAFAGDAPVPPPAAPVHTTTDTLAAALSGDALTAAGTTVLTLFFLAVLLESALALLFNWRPFIETFNARATRPLIAFVVAMIAVLAYNYDAITALMDAVQNNKSGSPIRVLGQVLTAAILAGGSAGVNTMLVALGFREVKTPTTVAPKVPPEYAWIAVQVTEPTPSANGGSDLYVRIGPPDATTPTDAAKVRLAGIIGARNRGRRSGLGRFFLRPIGRFPAFGGYTVKASEACMVAVMSAPKADGSQQVLRSVSFTPAPGAVIDLNFTIA